MSNPLWIQLASAAGLTLSDEPASKLSQYLGLANVSVSSWRAEDVGHSNSRETCDIVAARAVGAMVFLVEWCLPLVKKGGKLLAMKGPRIAEELPAAQKAIKLLGGGPAIVH